MINYVSTKRRMKLEGKAYTGYGVAVVEDGRIVQRYDDVSCAKTEVDKLVDLCNSLELSPDHIEDVLDDFLADA